MNCQAVGRQKIREKRKMERYSKEFSMATEYVVKLRFLVIVAGLEKQKLSIVLTVEGRFTLVEFSGSIRPLP